MNVSGFSEVILFLEISKEMSSGFPEMLTDGHQLYCCFAIEDVAIPGSD